ncbi:DUF1828 domain-containing protein [Loigolactobacillus bifermentans]|uniref:DUF1828 domain-containing protein n=1 Tax=Loigolactobacillus bifermentans DSM 20003 TaxID=1423726 RepID=A0A0R1GL42_9LACO|nr:DUF1828 domain-containing protein [Loigolactobacillus bifermentans]KRK32593.1 hypothetical protein FC07_GL002020 [Loigolactobacillus bifermentans DSM 20003]
MDVNALNTSYTNWFKQNFKFTSHPDFIEIQTPFTDPLHDYIALVLIPTKNGFCLSDDGYTLNELATRNFDLTCAQPVLQSLGITVNAQQELTVTFPDLAALPAAQNRLIQGILQLYGMAATPFPTQ